MTFLEARSNVICYYDPALHTLNTNMDTITPDSETGGNTHNKYQLNLIQHLNQNIQLQDTNMSGRAQFDI